MSPLSTNDIESELSYAYLHAVAAHAGAACVVANRLMDGNGIDAILTAWGPFPGGGTIEEITLHIQLKATSVPPTISRGNISYFVKGAERYDDLRKETSYVHRLLVVLFLPPKIEHWLAISDEQLLLKKCAYWVSLRGGPNPERTGKTIYFPQEQRFDTAHLKLIFAALSRNEKLRYEQS